jgi:hypothetical protein
MNGERHHLTIDLHIHGLNQAADREILTAIQSLVAQGVKIMAAIDDLQAAVAAEDTVIDGAVTLLQGIAARLDAAGVDPAKLAALSTDIKTKTQALADAVASVPPAPTP